MSKRRFFIGVPLVIAAMALFIGARRRLWPRVAAEAEEGGAAAAAAILSAAVVVVVVVVAIQPLLQRRQFLRAFELLVRRVARLLEFLEWKLAFIQFHEWPALFQQPELE